MANRLLIKLQFGGIFTYPPQGYVMFVIEISVRVALSQHRGHNKRGVNQHDKTEQNTF